MLRVPENVTVLGVVLVLPELAWTGAATAGWADPGAPAPVWPDRVAASAGADRVSSPTAASAPPTRQRHRVFSVLDPFVWSPSTKFAIRRS